MVLAWRRLGHGVVAVPMDGLPGAVLAPEDQGGSDHDLGWLRAALELPPPALDEDPVGHIAAHRQEGGIARYDARTGHELCRHPVPAFADFRPAAFDTAPEPTLADGIGVGAQRLDGFGISVGDRGERLAEPVQEWPQGICSVLVHHGLLLSPRAPPVRLGPIVAKAARRTVVPKIHLPRTRVNKGKKRRAGIRGAFLRLSYISWDSRRTRVRSCRRDAPGWCTRAAAYGDLPGCHRARRRSAPRCRALRPGRRGP